MIEDPWREYTKRWDLLKPPMRPTPAVVDAMVRCSAAGPVLMMGVTPEIHAAFDDITAVDRDGSMIAAIWPGDTYTKRAMRISWQDMSWPKGTFSTVVGDCALNMLGSLDAMREFQEGCTTWLRSGGTLVQRIMVRPDDDVTLDDLRADMTGRINFHAFRWRLAQHIAASTDGVVGHQVCYDLFHMMCDDRDALAAASGWSRVDIDCIDLYRDSKVVIAWPTRSQWMDTVPGSAHGTEIINVGGYDLSESCPLLRWRNA